MKRFFVFLSVLCLSSLATAQEAERPASPERLTVIELFTSQGCSSCPPADAALRTMRDRPGVLALSWPVDYWDRLGWEDTFADPYNAQRQAAYNKRLGRGGVFTPQMIFDGRFECVGSRKEEVSEKIQFARTLDRPEYTIGLDKAGDQITLSLPQSIVNATISVRVVWYQADATVEIGDGENRGRRLHYTNVVRDFKMLDDWNGDAVTHEINTAEAPENVTHIAVLLQEEYGHGPIVGAATLSLRD
ncbi:hypothetical protein GCM10017044_05800 [Kordiimonas sediminis]|uniref:DUF1223 domain-containing protein n=2 Tax=Kordiimonas sediminis TaxID=1735581 RepID=A0A919ALJ1_9PROT|nr:hypothetical protein GCM10017044_05800 [Kordiimonas sediminis]